VTAALSFVSWKFVEQPVRAKRWIFGRGSAVFASAGTVTLVAAAFGLATYVATGFPNRFEPVTLQILKAELELAPEGSTCNLTLDRINAGEFCRIGAPAVRPSFVLWGDSHASALAAGVGLAASDHYAAGALASYGGCIPALGIERPDLGVCEAVNDAVLANVLASPTLKTIILAGRWALWTEGTRYKHEDRLPKELVVSSRAGSATNRAAVARGLEALLEKLEAAGKEVWLVGPVPEIGYPVPRALYLARIHPLLARDVRPSVGEFNERQRFVLDMLARLVTRYRAHAIWPHRQLCNGAYCAVAAEGLPLYADDGHLTVLGARSVSPLFNPAFEAPVAPGN
jgi:hypothetical protein